MSLLVCWVCHLYYVKVGDPCALLLQTLGRKEKKTLGLDGFADQAELSGSQQPDRASTAHISDYTLRRQLRFCSFTFPQNSPTLPRVVFVLQYSCHVTVFNFAMLPESAGPV